MRFIQTPSHLIYLVLVMAACQSQATPTPYPTYTLYPTYTPLPTYTPASTPSASLQSSEAGARVEPSPIQLETLLWPSGPRDDVIPFTDAANFIGERLTVEGTIVDTHNSGKAVFLNFGQKFKDTFTAVIFPDDWTKFPLPPEDLFYGKRVRIEGLIEEYQDAPEIIITEPWQIEVALTLGQPIITDCNCQQQGLPQEPKATMTQPLPAPTEAEPTIAAVATAGSQPTLEPSPSVVPQPQIISWEDAAAYQGQTITVEGQIISTFNSGNVVFLNFDEDFRNTFTVAIFPDAWPLFPAPPEDYYRHQQIRVTGLIKMYQNSPEIIVDNPNQIEIME